MAQPQSSQPTPTQAPASQPAPGQISAGRAGRPWWWPLPRLANSLSRDPTMQLPWIGFRIFKWLLLLAIIGSIWIVVFAAFTYPDEASILQAFPANAATEAKLQAVRTARADWLTSVKDLGQLFLLTPIFPLIGAVIGYIFGVSRQAPSASDQPNGQTKATR